jgi:hypothetical protein
VRLRLACDGERRATGGSIFEKRHVGRARVVRRRLFMPMKLQPVLIEQ